MAVSRLNPRAPPFDLMALARSQLYAPTPAALLPADLLPPQCLYPPSPACVRLVACGGCWWSCGGLASNGCTCAQVFTAGPPAFPSPAACVQVQTTSPWAVYCLSPPPRPVYCMPPPPKPATSCRIIEIGEDGSEESAKDEPSPRSVLTICSRKLLAAPLPRRAALPPPPPPPPRRPSLQGKARGGWCPRLAFDPNTNDTSLMIRNIPNKFMKKRFIAMLDQHCAEENTKLGGGDEAVKSEYDFLYVPVDFWTKCNKGYAFVNMTTAVAARRLHAHLHGHPWEASGSKKVCDVVHARIKGLKALVRHFSGSLFPCGDEELLPVRFEPPRDGVRLAAEHVVGRLLPSTE